MPGPSSVSYGNVANTFLLQTSVATASVGANTTVERTFTVPGLVVGDYVAVSKPTAQAGISVGSRRVSAANTLAITFVNASGGGVTPTTENYTILVVRSQYDNPATQIPTAIA